MEIGDIHYVVFSNDNTIVKIESLESMFRNDIKLILKRTFIKKSRGQGLYNYFKTEVINTDFKIVQNNHFKWNKLNCTIVRDEHWGYPIKNNNNASVVLDIEIEDHLGVKSVCLFDMHGFNAFKVLQHV